MKNILIIISCFVFFASAKAQSKSQVFTDVSNTLNEFMTDLSLASEDPITIKQSSYSLAYTFGSPEYFLRNGEQMSSFQNWLESYLSIQLNNKGITHSINILSQSLKKVDEDNDTDKRYSFKAIVKRELSFREDSLLIPDDELIFTVVWNGAEEYVSIVGIDGIISDLPSKSLASPINLDQIVILLNKGKLKDAIAQIKPLAEQGYVDAQMVLGQIYLDDVAGTPNYEESFKWHYRAAEQGHVDAQNNLGSFYARGEGVSQDYQKAFDWYSKAAEQGSSGALFNLGYMYLKGYWVEQDYSKAFIYFNSAAEKNHTTAQFNLGVIYYNGYGMVEKDITKAVELFEIAANKGHASALYNLGLCYRNGIGVEKDDNKSFIHLEKAAEAGHPAAQYALGECYIKGMGVQVDLFKALGWFYGAAEQGHKEAIAIIELAKKNQPNLQFFSPKISRKYVKE